MATLDGRSRKKKTHTDKNINGEGCNSSSEMTEMVRLADSRTTQITNKRMYGGKRSRGRPFKIT